MDIRGDHTRMAEVGKKLAEDLYTEYSDEIKRIFDEIETLKSKWVGIDQTSFIKNILSKKPALDNLGRVINGYGVFLVDSSAHIAKAQADIADAASAL